MLSPELNQIVQQQMASGQFTSPDHFLLVAAQQYVLNHSQFDANFKEELKAGFEQFEKGESLSLDSSTLRQYFTDRARDLQAKKNGDASARP